MIRFGTQARSLSSVLREMRGCWVAVDRVTGEPLEAADSLYELARRLRSRQIWNLAVMRAPDPSEPELVGPG